MSLTLINDQQQHNLQNCLLKKYKQDLMSKLLSICTYYYTDYTKYEINFGRNVDWDVYSVYDLKISVLFSLHTTMFHHRFTIP